MPHTGSRRSAPRPAGAPATGWWMPRHRFVEPELVGDEPGKQEAVGDVRTPTFSSERRSSGSASSYVTRAADLVDRVDEVPTDAVLQLQGIPPAWPATSGRPFRQRLGDHKVRSPHASIFWNDDVGEALEGVDLDVADSGEVGEDVGHSDRGTTSWWISP